MTRYNWVASQKADDLPVTVACGVAEVSPSAFYEWAAKEAAGPSDAEAYLINLINLIIDIHADADLTYGSPRMAPELRRRGYSGNHKRVQRLMRDNDIVGVTERKKVRTTLPAGGAPPLPDLVEQRLVPGAPDVAWCGDITYVGTGEGWLYLSSVLDLGSRCLLGWSMDDNMETTFVADVLTMATELRGVDLRGTIFHCDCRSQYLSARYREICDSLGIRQSAGRVATCFDNSPIPETRETRLERTRLLAGSWSN